MEPDAQPTNNELISRLILAVEQTYGHAPKTPKDFNALRQSIFERTGTLLSPTTLKRLWGYLEEDVVPRRFTLDTLCRYAGWAGLDGISSVPPCSESGPLSVRRIDLSDNGLQEGDRIIISWLPDRKIIVDYLGRNQFRIHSALNTRLQAGDTFSTGLIADDQPLYLDRLTRDGADLGVYVCGRRSGIRFILDWQKD